MYTTLNEIREYGPCKPEWDKLLKSLGKTKADDEPLSFKHILETNGIEEAAWCLKVLPYIDTCLFRADIAESVLHIFESESPEDNRPRLAIKAVRDFHLGNITETELDAASFDAYVACHDVAHIAHAAADTDYTIHGFCIIYIADCVNDVDSIEDIRIQKWRLIEELFIKHFV